jgi:hypothetical protein
VKLPGPQEGLLLGGILLIQGASELIGTDGMLPRGSARGNKRKKRNDRGPLRASVKGSRRNRNDSGQKRHVNTRGSKSAKGSKSAEGSRRNRNASAIRRRGDD